MSANVLLENLKRDLNRVEKKQNKSKSDIDLSDFMGFVQKYVKHPKNEPQENWFGRRPYLPGLYNAIQDNGMPQNLVIVKARQMEISEYAVNFLLYWPLKHPGTYIYSSSTLEKVQRFSKDRFTRQIKRSPALKQFVGRSQVYSVEYGNSILYFYSAFGNMDTLRGIPADALILDEYQDVESEALPVAQETLSKSDFKKLIVIGTPKEAGTNFEKKNWDMSNKQEWDGETQQWKVTKTDGDIYFTGFHISQEMALGLDPHWITEKVLKYKLDTYSRQQYVNEVLGQFYTGLGRPITEHLMWTTFDPSLPCKDYKRGDPLFAGVDWGVGRKANTVFWLIKPRFLEPPDIFTFDTIYIEKIDFPEVMHHVNRVKELCTEVFPISCLCLDGNSLIDTPFGNQLLQNIRKGDVIYGYKNGHKVLTRVINTASQKHEIMYTITLDDGTYINSSADHKFLTSNNEWIEAKDLNTRLHLIVVNGEKSMFNNGRDKIYKGQLCINESNRTSKGNTKTDECYNFSNTETWSEETPASTNDKWPIFNSNGNGIFKWNCGWRRNYHFNHAQLSSTNNYSSLLSFVEDFKYEYGTKNMVRTDIQQEMQRLYKQLSCSILRDSNSKLGRNRKSFAPNLSILVNKKTSMFDGSLLLLPKKKFANRVYSNQRDGGNFDSNKENEFKSLKIIKIERSCIQRILYDMETTNHNYIANGIVVHNCADIGQGYLNNQEVWKVLGEKFYNVQYLDRPATPMSIEPTQFGNTLYLDKVFSIDRAYDTIVKGRFRIYDEKDNMFKEWIISNFTADYPEVEVNTGKKVWKKDPNVNDDALKAYIYALFAFEIHKENFIYQNPSDFLRFV